MSRKCNIIYLFFFESPRASEILMQKFFGVAMKFYGVSFSFFCLLGVMLGHGFTMYVCITLTVAY